MPVLYFLFLTAPKPKNQVIAELAPKIAKPGITSGKATIEAQRLYAEVESRYGQAAEQILESFQPGQEPNKFLDGIQNAYFAGKLGSSTALKNSSAAAYLTEHQRAAAFELGAQDAGTGSDYGDMKTWRGAFRYFRETIQEKKGEKQSPVPRPLDLFPENDIMDKTRNRHKRRFWDIMSRQAGIPQDYLRMLTEKFDQGTDLGKRVFLKYVPSDSVADFAEKGGNYFGKDDKRIHLNAQKDISDPRGAGTGFFHEHGHYIDRSAGGGGLGKRVSMRNTRFSGAIRADFEMVCRRLDQQGMLGGKSTYEILTAKIKGCGMHAVSDIIGGLTKNECVGDYRHKEAYWEKPGALERETFAHMFEALFDEKKYTLLQEYFPNAFNEFIRILEELI